MSLILPSAASTNVKISKNNLCS